MLETPFQFLGQENSPGGRHSNPLQYSCLENSHGQRNLAGYSPWGCKELNTAEQLNFNFLFQYWVKYKNHFILILVKSLPWKMGFTCVLSMRIPALKEVSLTGPRWPSQQVVERGLAAGQGPHCTPASCLSSQCMPSALGRVPHRCSDVKLLPSSLCICMLRVFKMVLPSE